MHSSDYSGSLHYRTLGEGQSIVLLHGFLEDMSMWEQLASELKSHYHLVIIDLPCHGKSRFSGEICEMSYMAKEVEKLLSSLEIDNPTIIGHSMGGYVGLEFIKTQPANLILLHSNFWADPEEKKGDRNRVIEIVKKNPSLFINESIPNLFAAPNRDNCLEPIKTLVKKAKTIPASEIVAATAGMRDREANHALMNTGSVKIIHGELDPIISTEMIMSHLEEIAVQPDMVTISNCGHMSIWEAPDQLLAAVKKLLKSRN